MDSPLAIEATEVFMRNKESCFDEEALSYVRRGINPIGVSGLIPAVTSDASKAINADKRPKVILSASGMCEAGRIQTSLETQSLETGKHNFICGISSRRLFGQAYY